MPCHIPTGQNLAILHLCALAWVLLNPQILQVFEKVLSSPLFSLVSGLTWSAEAKAYPRSKIQIHMILTGLEKKE